MGILTPRSIDVSSETSYASLASLSLLSAIPGALHSGACDSRRSYSLSSLTIRSITNSPRLSFRCFSSCRPSCEEGCNGFGAHESGGVLSPHDGVAQVFSLGSDNRTTLLLRTIGRRPAFALSGSCVLGTSTFCYTAGWPLSPWLSRRLMLRWFRVCPTLI